MKKCEAIKNYPGIYRILVFNKDTNNFEEPRWGNKFFAYIEAGKVNGSRRRIKRSFRSFSEAKEYRQSSNTIKSVLLASLKEKSKMTFRELTSRWVDDALPHLQRTTQVRNKSYLKHFEMLNNYPVDEITPSTIDAWIRYIKRPEYLITQNSTRCAYDHEFTVLRQILNYYSSRFDRNYRMPFLKDHNKMLKVREKEALVKDLSIDEFNRFAGFLYEDCLGSNCEAIYYLALFQYFIYGRVQDAAGLRYEDFDFIKNKVLIRQKIQWGRAKNESHIISAGSKANSGKVVPIHDFMAKVFREWIIKSGVRSGLLFTIGGEIISYRQISYRYDKALKKAGISFRGTHLIRHASLSEHYETNMDILATSKVAGHSDLRATARYTKARDEKVTETQQKMGNKLSQALQNLVMVPNGSQIRI